MVIGLQLYFENYTLTIYNPADLSEGLHLNNIIGVKVIQVKETMEEAILIFDNHAKLTIDMRSESYQGPEAMCLFGPDNFCAVWN